MRVETIRWHIHIASLLTHSLVHSSLTHSLTRFDTDMDMDGLESVVDGSQGLLFEYILDHWQTRRNRVSEE